MQVCRYVRSSPALPLPSHPPCGMARVVGGSLGFIQVGLGNLEGLMGWVVEWFACL